MRADGAVHIARELAIALVHQGVAVDDIPRQFDVIVGELANLGIIHAKNFSFFGGAQAQAGDEVHDEEDEAGAAEGVGEAGDGVRKLEGELDPVAI